MLIGMLICLYNTNKFSIALYKHYFIIKKDYFIF